MSNNSNHDAAIQHENAAKAHMIAAKHLEKNASDADRAQGRTRQTNEIEIGEAWYHADALKDSQANTH